MKYIYDIKDDEIIGEDWEFHDALDRIWHKVTMSIGYKVKDFPSVEFRKPVTIKIPEYFKTFL